MAKNIIKKTLIGLLIILVFLQFIHPAKNINKVITPQDISVIYPLPDSISILLQKACYDCHSNNTRYPWYNNMEPVAFWLNDHVNGGKANLNFSAFGGYSKDKQIKNLKGVAKELEEGSMPLGSYQWIHKDAVLSEHDKNMLITWANGLEHRIAMQGVSK